MLQLYNRSVPEGRIPLDSYLTVPWEKHSGPRVVRQLIIAGHLRRQYNFNAQTGEAEEKFAHWHKRQLFHQGVSEEQAKINRKRRLFEFFRHLQVVFAIGYV